LTDNEIYKRTLANACAEDLYPRILNTDLEWPQKIEVFIDPSKDPIGIYVVHMVVHPVFHAIPEILAES